ncbi:hypothetical protein [Anaerosphaera multitolerans]|uniref:Uncharacterized protein n=1 Tax=Anaerosphaera multitolerans TaxID=2487351 RepID=A0A437SAD1_9FIRM|nr:hypothetical protein [Anaerosphaera multitolerans]RVU55764.1 hypothetical protein EF514_00705 [Anaerosphaera multitolerans]
MSFDNKEKFKNEIKKLFDSIYDLNNQDFPEEFKFLQLNEQDLLKSKKRNSKCNYVNCNERAIGSHSYSRDFLNSITQYDDEIFCLNLDNMYRNMYINREDFPLNKKHINNAGVENLFCSKHDNEVFERIENLRFKTDLDTYLYLYGYRFFIFEYYHENMTKKELQPKIYENKSYSKQINKELQEKYLSDKEYIIDSLDNLYNKSNFDEVKKIYDKIFCDNSLPTCKEFSENFILKKFKLKGEINFFANGSMAYKNDDSDINSHLPSVYAIVPDREYQYSYFTIITPKQEEDSMKIVFDEFDKLYHKYIKEDNKEFLKCVMLFILDCSQNIFFVEKFYNRLTKNNDIDNIKKVYYYLAQARLFNDISADLKQIAYEYISKINFI